MTIFIVYSSAILFTNGEEEETMYFMLHGVHPYHKNVVEQQLHIFFDHHISRKAEYYASSLGFNACNFFL